MASGSIDLSKIAADNYRNNAQHRTTLLQIYSSDTKNLDFITSYLSSLSPLPEEMHPVAIIYARLQDFNIMQSDNIMYGKIDGELVVGSSLKQVKLPDSMYLLFMSPIDHVDDRQNIVNARRAIAAVRATIVCALGRFVLLDRAAECIVHGYDDNFSFAGPFFRMPQPMDNRVLTKSGAIREILNKQTTPSTPNYDRTIRAFEFVDRAITERDEAQKFMMYWIGLELIAGGTSDKIADAIAKSYSTHKTHVYDVMGFREISRKRHDFFHQGVIPDFDHKTERLLQAIFLDLCRFKLGLDSQGFYQAILD